ESTVSTLSSDSCEYYQTEIFDLLPSIQASRPEQNRHDFSEETNQGGREAGEKSGQLSRGPRDKTSMQPLRNLPMCIQGKRDAERRKLENNDINFWESWRKTQSTNRKRVREQIKEALSGLVPWRQTLRTIEGKFGVGVKSYFVFLRYLIYLNLLHCVLIGGFIVFYGFYTRGSLELKCLNTPLLYLAGIFSVIFLSLILVVRTTVGYKHTWMLGKRYSMNVSYKIFCGWDFTIQDPTAAALKHGFIRNDLKEQSFSLRAAQRTLGEKVRLYLLRIVLNLITLSLLGGAFYFIYFYFPPITITFVNLVLPHIFRKISSFEDYSFTMQVNVTLLSIFLKLASLGIYLFFAKCKENQFGREMYKLSIFNFLATFFNVFFFNYPRLARISGKQRFLIPFNVLDLVYSQTVSWVGVYYCPLLPVIGIVSLVVTFYVKKFSVMRCCVPEQRMFRGSSSSVLFHFMLLLGLFMCAATLGFNHYPLQRTEGRNCGPFRNEQTMFTVTGDCVKSLPSPAQTTIRYLTSEAFALPLILAESIFLTSYVSRRRANQRAIERLKDMLVM
uniref:Transmembrane channel-like protein n=1 Tax=Neolamprologus brichardi TaxID=32507 RepID=A0A3Q4N9V7_NEOBR